MNFEPVFRALVECVLFLSLTDDESIVEPDSAVRLLEEISYHLDKLDEESKSVLTNYLSRLADEQRKKYGETSSVWAIETMAKDLNLVTDMD